MTHTRAVLQNTFTHISKKNLGVLAKQPLFGNIVHSVLETCIEPEKKLDYDQMHELYTENIASYDPENKISEVLLSAGSQILDDFYDEYQDTIFDVYDKEYGFSFVIGSYLVFGYIDRIDIVDENNIKIIDYKTGKWEVTQKDVKNNLQLGIYAVAVSRAFPGKTITAELHYLRSGKKKGHTYTEEDLEQVKVNLINSITEIIEDKSFLPTKNERICSYCDHAQSGACNTGTFRLKKKAKA